MAVDFVQMNLLFRFRDVEIPNDTPQATGNPTKRWDPPETRAAFVPRDEVILIWNNGQIRQTPTIPPCYQRYGSCSLFHDSYDGFRQVRFSCIEEDVSRRREKDERDCWKELRFEPPEQDVLQHHPDMILVGSTLADRQIEGPINNALEKLFGIRYFVPGPGGRNEEHTYDLAGSLPILIGLVAFTAKWTNLAQVIRQTFTTRCGMHRVPCFVPPRALQREDQHHRGLVVDVRFDSTSHSKEEVQDYELGHFGPILKACSNGQQVAPVVNTEPVPLHLPLQA